MTSTAHLTEETAMTENTARWIKGRDDYGRTTQTLTDSLGYYGVVVTIPRRSHAALGYSHISNDWTNQDRNAAVDQHTSLAAAKARLESIRAAAVTA